MLFHSSVLIRWQYTQYTHNHGEHSHWLGAKTEDERRWKWNETLWGDWNIKPNLSWIFRQRQHSFWYTTKYFWLMRLNAALNLFKMPESHSSGNSDLSKCGQTALNSVKETCRVSPVGKVGINVFVSRRYRVSWYLRPISVHNSQTSFCLVVWPKICLVWRFFIKFQFRLEVVHQNCPIESRNLYFSSLIVIRFDMRNSQVVT